MKPIAITIASGKGGTGKSLLTVSLAVCAKEAGYRVAMMDLEPQSSVHLWWKLRGKPDNPQAIDAATVSPVEEAAILRREFDCLLIDTSPLGIDRIEEAVIAGDATIIPVRASVFDAAAVRAVVDICKKHRRPFAFVVMDYDAGWRRLNDSMDALLSKMGTLLPARTSHRQAYPAALNQGKSAGEHPDSRQRREATAELMAIWEAARALAESSNGRR